MIVQTIAALFHLWKALYKNVLFRCGALEPGAQVKFDFSEF